METGYDLICIGLSIMDSIIRGFDQDPVSATGYVAESGTLEVGGDAVNEAIAAAKLGVRTGIICHVGKDAPGNTIVAELIEQGVDTDLIIRSEEHPTPVTTIFVLDDGNRRSITNSAHRYNFHPEKYTDSLPDTKAVILGSLFRAPFDDPDIIYKVLSDAKSHGALTFADCKLPNFRRLSLEDLKECLPLIDFITPNEDEGRYYTGANTPEEMAEIFLSYGVGNVIIKLGDDGCYMAGKEGSYRLPAYDVDTVDGTGAGDNFIAGFATEILRGNPYNMALRFANACGAICTTAIGAGTALRNRDQVIEFILDKAVKNRELLDEIHNKQD